MYYYLTSKRGKTHLHTHTHIHPQPHTQKEILKRKMEKNSMEKQMSKRVGLTKKSKTNMKLWKNKFLKNKQTEEYI